MRVLFFEKIQTFDPIEYATDSRRGFHVTPFMDVMNPMLVIDDQRDSSLQGSRETNTQRGPLPDVFRRSQANRVIFKGCDDLVDVSGRAEPADFLSRIALTTRRAESRDRTPSFPRGSNTR
jgi:hypothetical protein